MSGTTALTPAEFSSSFKMRMIRSYPAISGMDDDQFYRSTVEDKDAAFQRILTNRHTRLVCHVHLKYPAEIESDPS